MGTLKGTVVSVHAGDNADLSKDEQPSITVELDGIVGDRHRGPSRRCWAGDKQSEGTLRRNERHWTAVSAEELEEISADMDLAEPLTAAELGANLCIAGIAQLSRLPKGSVLKFPSGAELVVVEYNPPCHDMGRQLAARHSTKAGEPVASTAFSKAAKLKRGVLGIVDVPGTISAGDTVEVEVYEHPSWLERNA
jgi:MOSC domain-containing protein YiiM